MTKRDFFREVLDRMVAQGMPPDLAEATYWEAVRLGGGERHYLPKRPAEQRAQPVAQALARGVPLSEIRGNSGIPRTTLYRLLGRREPPGGRGGG